MAKPPKTGDRNVFGLRALSVSGGMVDLVCDTCHAAGTASIEEFGSTRCGSAACASTQGRTE